LASDPGVPSFRNSYWRADERWNCDMDAYQARLQAFYRHTIRTIHDHFWIRASIFIEIEYIAHSL
jgi:hypothetical protein